MKKIQVAGVSKGRRRVLAAGGAATFLPALSLAASQERDADAAQGGGAPLLLSGCASAADGSAIAGCRLDLVGNDGVVAQVVTDGAGRFLLETRLPARGQPLRFVAAGRRPVPLTLRGPGAATLERDADGMLRAAVGLILT